jgi:trans-aconitate 2-methyltransferase
LATHEKWSPGEYAAQTDMQLRQSLEAINRLTLPDDARILDVGSGDGRITAELARRVPNGEVLGIDLSAPMVEYANEAVAPRYSNLSFARCDGGDLSSQLMYRDRFDLVTSFSVFHWLEDPDGAWEGFRDVLRKGSGPFEAIRGSSLGGAPLRALIGFQLTHPHLWDFIDTLVANPEWAPHFEAFVDPYKHWTAEQVVAFAEGARFNVERIDDILSNEWFPSPGVMHDFLAAWVPSVIHLASNAEAQKAFLDVVVNHLMDAIPLDSEQRIAVRMRRVIVECTL